MRGGAPRRGLEAVAVMHHGIDCIVGCEMMREGEAHADLGGQFRGIIAGTKQPDRRQPGVVGHGDDVVVGVSRRKFAGLPQDQLVQPLQEIVALAAVEATAERVSRRTVGAGGAAETKVDPAGKQRFQHLEALGHHQRRVIGQHHPAGADTEVLRHRRDLPDHHVGRRARDGGEVVMFGEPVAGIAEPIDVARQIDAVAQRRRRLGAGGDHGEVED